MNKDAAPSLGEKFGTTPQHAKELLRLGMKLGLEPIGTHFHVGIYHRLSDAPDGIRYPITVPGRSARLAPFTLCGPTCDSADTISKGQHLPGDIQAGDLFILHRATAYAEGLFSHFNGIEPPEVKYAQEIA